MRFRPAPKSQKTQRDPEIQFDSLQRGLRMALIAPQLPSQPAKKLLAAIGQPVQQNSSRNLSAQKTAAAQAFEIAGCAWAEPEFGQLEPTSGIKPRTPGEGFQRHSCERGVASPAFRLRGKSQTRRWVSWVHCRPMQPPTPLTTIVLPCVEKFGVQLMTRTRRVNAEGQALGKEVRAILR